MADEVKIRTQPMQASAEAAGQVPLLDQIVRDMEIGRTPEQRNQTSSRLREFLSRREDILTKKELEEGTYPASLEEEILAEIAKIDGEISDQLNNIMHHKEFQKLEASWLGLKKLVAETEIAESLKIRVIDVTKKELARDLKGDYLDSVLFQKIHERGYGKLGGKPYAALIGDFEFTHDKSDMDLLTSVSQVAAVSHAPFIAAASPAMFGWNRFGDMENAGALLKILQDNEHIHWRNFREHPNSRYVGLVLPHVLLRTPYTKEADTSEFSYQEDVSGPDNSMYAWGNAAYAFGECLTGAFFNYGWCTAIRGVEGGGLVELPVHAFTVRGVDGKAGPTELAITDGREKEFSNQGLIALCQIEDKPQAAFMSGQSCQKPQQYYEDEATASAELSARLPNIFAVSRFAHYLKVILRDKVGSFMSREDCEKLLNRWISHYILDKPGGDQIDKATHPLKAARIVVEDVPGRPGHYQAKAYLRPHYQLEEIAISMRLVANLPTLPG